MWLRVKAVNNVNPLGNHFVMGGKSASCRIYQTLLSICNTEFSCDSKNLFQFIFIHYPSQMDNVRLIPAQLS